VSKFFTFLKKRQALHRRAVAINILFYNCIVSIVQSVSIHYWSYRPHFNSIYSITKKHETIQMLDNSEVVKCGIVRHQERTSSPSILQSQETVRWSSTELIKTFRNVESL